MRIGQLAISLLLIFCQTGGQCLRAAPSSPSSKGSSDASGKADPYALPDGDSKQLLAFLQKIAKQRPKNSEAQTKRREAVVGAAEKILEGKPDAAELRKLVEEAAKYIRTGPIQPDDAKLATRLGEYIEQSGEIKLAIETYECFGRLFAAQADTKDTGKQLLDTARNVRLLKTPFQLEGRLLTGANLNWAGYRGKVVLVDFWATYCQPCMKAMPNIKENYAKYHDRGFEVVGISIDKIPRDKVAAVVMKEQIPWAICRDADSPSSMAQYYGVTGIPTFYLIGRDGKVASLNARGANLGPEIEKALAAKTDSTDDVADAGIGGKSKRKAAGESRKKRETKDTDLLATTKKSRVESAPQAVAAMRDWSDTSGKFHAKARFRSLVGKVVKLETEDGRTISVPLEKLGEDDREYIRKRGK